MMKRRYYAVEWPYGSLAWGTEHGLPSDVYAFGSTADRDAWLSCGNPQVAAPGYREAITAKRAKWLQASPRYREVITVRAMYVCDECGKIVTPDEGREHASDTAGYQGVNADQAHLTYTDLHQARKGGD